MKRTQLIILGIVACALAAGSAYAGMKSNYTVNINTTSRYASGSLADTRSMNDSSSYLDLQVSAYSTSGPRAWVYGYSATSKLSFVCSTTNASLISLAQAVNGDSYISVQWDTSGNCTSLSVMSGSEYSPKQP
jgi:hypothetical protein